MMMELYLPYLIESHISRIISKQEQDGWYFDTDKANILVADLESKCSELEQRILPHFPLRLVTPYNGKPISKPFLKSGAYSEPVVKWYGEQPIVAGPFTRIEWEPVNLSSEQQVKDALYTLGWQPTEWNYKKDSKTKRNIYVDGIPVKTSPKLTEDSYDSLTVGIGPDVKRYLVYKHRLSAIKGWLENVRDDHTIQARANPLGTPTGRMTHSIVVNVPKANDKVIYGKECRSLFTHRPGRVLVGYDASGLEARMEAHETYQFDDGEYARILLDGDIHTKNTRVFYDEETEGWDDKTIKSSHLRSLSKNGKYALNWRM